MQMQRNNASIYPALQLPKFFQYKVEPSGMFANGHFPYDVRMMPGTDPLFIQVSRSAAQFSVDSARVEALGGIFCYLSPKDQQRNFYLCKYNLEFFIWGYSVQHGQEQYAPVDNAKNRH